MANDPDAVQPPAVQPPAVQPPGVQAVQPPAVEAVSSEAKKLKDDFLVPLGAVFASCYVIVDAIATPEKAFKAFIAAFLALALFGVYLFYRGERTHPVVGKLSYWLIVVGLVGFVMTGFLELSTPPLIKLFDVDKEPWKRPLANNKGKVKSLKIARAVNDNGEVLPAIDANFGLVVFLKIAKEKTATELNIQSLSLDIKKYQPLTKGWRFVMEEMKLTTHFDYSATLEPEPKVVYATHDYPSDPQIRDDFTAALHLKVDALKPGIYTFTCKVEVNCHKQTEQKETEEIKIVVMRNDPVGAIPEPPKKEP